MTIEKMLQDLHQLSMHTSAQMPQQAQPDIKIKKLK
jgi:hypothetical protein